MDDPVGEADFPNILLRAVRQADLPPCHHLDDEAMDADGEPVHIQEFFQKGVVDVFVRLLEVTIELRNFFLVFFIVFEAIFSRTASLHPWEDRKPLCSHSRMLVSTLPNNHPRIRLWMASVTIFVMVGRQVMGR